MSDPLPREIRCILVPVGNMRLLLPNATVAMTIFPTGNVLLTANGRAIAPDFNASSNKLIINDYTLPLSGATDNASLIVKAL